MRISLRQATVEDIGAIRELLTERDERPWRDEDIHWLFFGLDPKHFVGWIALDEDRPVGFSGMFLRTLLWQGTEIPAGYWTNLYVTPGYTGTMLYPRLPMAMFDWARQHQLAFLYAAVRRKKVAEAHRAIGFKKIGEFQTQFYVLRPALLVAKHFGLGPWSSLLTAPVDAMYRGLLSLVSLFRAHGPRGVPETLNDDAATEMLNLLRAESTNELVQAWSVPEFEYRYRQTTEEEQYHHLVSRDRGEIVAAVIYRCGVHRTGIRVAAVLEALCRPNEELRLAELLNEVMRFGNRRKCEMVLIMPTQNPGVARALQRCGFRVTPIRYDMLIWPGQALDQYPFCGEIANWRFSLGDHDAF